MKKFSASPSMLSANNCDSANVVASGEYPLLIDTDQLLCPEVIGENDSDRWFHDSILRVGFLPKWDGDIFAANALDSSVLGNIFPKQTNTIPEWVLINTDEMQLLPKVTVIPAGKNIVVLDGKTISPQNYVENIVSGFQEIFRIFIDQQETLLSSMSPLLVFAQCQSRFYLRPVSSYAPAFTHGLNSQYLKEDSQYNILIDRVLNHQVPNSIIIRSKEDQQKLLEAEAKSLKQQDIPIFPVSCNSTNFEVNQHNSIHDFFKASGYQRLISRIQNLNAGELSLQVSLIRSSFYTKYAHLARNSDILQGNLSSACSFSQEDLYQEAIAIGEGLISTAIWDVDNGCNWLSIEGMMRTDRCQLKPLDDSLFMGRTGISLFLSALAKVSGDRQFRRTALGALDSLRQSIKKRKNLTESPSSEIGLFGLGGIIYSLVKISQFLDEPSLLEDGIQAARMLTPERIVSDTKLDIIMGVAGSILGLLSLYEATGEKNVLDIAVECGNHLLHQQSETCPRAWKTVSREPLTGFSHGAAGIALALIKLYATTGDEDYLVGSERGMVYERSVFNETIQNWPNFIGLDQSDGQIEYWNTWCHGSPGIGLARLASYEIAPSNEIYQEIEIALNTSERNGIIDFSLDHLCCGNFGRVELLVTASQVLKKRELLILAQQSASKAINRKKITGDYFVLPNSSNSIFSPSFYKGVAGIGYQLLRTTDPISFPSVLIWK
jgi:type 2 lantibiotic biosynthesis protein LanM